MAGLDTTDKLESPLDIIWQFDYAISIEKLRDLYSKAKRDQWNAEVDIDWDQEIDHGKDITDPNQNPLRESNFFKSLSETTKEEFNANNAAFILSQFLHGEQGALMVAAELVDAVPDYEGKLYAATQVMDEARHVEVFERYVTKLSKVYAIEPFLKKIIDATLTAPLWQSKCVGMQMVVEGLALGSFINMRSSTHDPLLKNMLEYVIKDEARHVAYGNVYVREAFKDMHADEREEVEDFAFKAVSAMQQTGLTDVEAGEKFEDRHTSDNGEQGFMLTGFIEVVKDSGIDPNDFLRGLMQDFQDGWRPQQPMGQIHTFHEIMMPSLFRVGAISNRARKKYESAGMQVNEDTSRLEALEQQGTIYH